MKDLTILPPHNGLKVFTPEELADLFRFRGGFSVEHWRKGQLLSRDKIKNLIVNVGLEYALGVAIGGTAKIATWYIGIFETNYTPIAAETMASLLAATTECVAYDEATRQQFVGVQTAQTITNNAARATFTMNQNKTVYGGFVTSNSAKLGATGTLWAGAQFSSPKVVAPTDLLRVRYDASVAAV